MATFSVSQMSEHVIFHYGYIKIVYHLFPFTTSKMFLLLYLKINFLLIHLITKLMIITLKILLFYMQSMKNLLTVHLSDKLVKRYLHCSGGA